MINNKGSIFSLKIENYNEQYQDVVVTAQGNIEATDENGISARYSFEESFTFTPGQQFTPFNNLTEEQVLSWVYDKWGQTKYDEITTKLSNIIYIRNNPPQSDIVNPPWI